MRGKQMIERKSYAGKLLTEKRLQAGVSQMDLAYMAEMSPIVYQRLETEKREFSDTRMKYGLAICAILGIDPYMIVFERDRESLRKWLLK